MYPEQNLIIDKEIRDSFSISRLSDTDIRESAAVHVTYHRIFILSKATGIIQIDQAGHSISGQEIFLISKGQIFSFSAASSLNGFEILFGDCFWERAPASASNCKAVLFTNTTLNQRLSLKTSDATSLLPVCEMMMQEYLNDDYPNKLDAMAAYLKIIMIKLANIKASSDGEINSFDNQLYQRFLQLVSTRFMHTREVADFARALSVSARKLSDVCRHKSGFGAKEIINGYIIAEAKRSLQFSAKPIKQIAYDLSFVTPEQFSHFFKKNTQVSPADYRHLFVNIGR
ncbi:helix-turn-helix domain-containing protein [Chitinophaga flava]|uniref:HTH araC/xylS-type domain-containing protein n=1 Tax=Chitinophaga flava TaxID=2259036 RepID=A0A365XW32_9BACT|nr:helix-turn-helix domain-containing protein [Chitinophaga flava]RBL90543.1 hypothetical protein DF182_29240 [Chitinophaga flava]